MSKRTLERAGVLPVLRGVWDYSMTLPTCTLIGEPARPSSPVSPSPPPKRHRSKTTTSSSSSSSSSLSCSPATVLRLCYVDLIQAVETNPKLVAGSFYSKQFIDRATRNRVTTTSGTSDHDKAMILIDAVEAKVLVAEDPTTVLENMCECLDTVLPTQLPVVNKIRTSLGE